MTISGYKISPSKNLSGADLSGANLSGADLFYANLSNADLSGADLSNANLSNANLSNANLSGVNLYRADLFYANLSGADLSNAAILCLGNMVNIKTLQFERWHIGYTDKILQIGCQNHPIEKWKKWRSPSGIKWINMMDINALVWANKYLDLVLKIIETSPAIPTIQKKGK